MKVKKCERCKHYERRTWVQYIKPNNFHPIGFTHAYAYCKQHGKRCADVKECGERKDGADT